MTKFDPDYVVPTAEILKDWLEEMHVSTHVAAARCYTKGEARDWAAGVLDRVLVDEPVDEVAVEVLSATTGVSKEFWRKFERNYRTGLAAGKKVL